MDTNNDVFLDLVNLVQSKEMVLPDFQRKFVWTKEMMYKLYASVLCRMPLGSILILKSSDDKFSCKEIGARKRTDEYNNSIPRRKEISYLIDGQQRLTSLFAGFNTHFLETFVNDSKDAAKDILLEMFFLKIPAPSNTEFSDLDIFNAHNLDFNNTSYKSNMYFPSGKVQKLICSSRLSQIVTLKKGEKYDIKSDEQLKQIKSYCTNEDNEHFFHIPLQFINSSEKNIQKAFNHIINTIASHFYPSDDEEDNKSDQSNWAANVRDYLNFCLSNIDLNKIIVSNSDKVRAIDIYSNLNIGGVSLSVFDLIMAKVGGVESENFYELLVNYIQNENAKGYPQKLYKSEDIDWIANEKYINASIEVADVISKDEEITKDYINIFLNVLSMYITQKSRPEGQDFNEDCTSENFILELDAIKIKESAKLVCNAIDRALFFFQTRCGIRTIGDINYKAELIAVAYFFTDDKIFNDKKSFYLFEYWYWISIFAYMYPSNQSKEIYKEIPKFEKYFKNPKKNLEVIEYLKRFESDVLNKLDYSDKNTLMLDKTAKKLPSPVMSKYICQYYLSLGYQDLCTDKKLNFLYADDLDIHHIMPLGSDPSYKNKKLTIGQSTKELRSAKNNPYNSPLNMIFISKESNRKISDMDYQSYSQSQKIKEILSNLDCQTFISESFTLEAFLETRYNGLKGKLKSRLENLYMYLSK